MSLREFLYEARFEVDADEGRIPEEISGARCVVFGGHPDAAAPGGWVFGLAVSRGFKTEEAYENYARTYTDTLQRILAGTTEQAP